MQTMEFIVGHLKCSPALPNKSVLNDLLFKERKYLQWDLFNTRVTEYS